MIKATSILHKAQVLNARPAELLELAIRNLKAGEKPILSPKEEEHSIGRDVQTVVPVSMSTYGRNQELHLPARIPVNHTVEQPKPASKEPLSDWKLPALVSRHVSPEV
uniref:dual specificity protein kinase Ttk-like n=1 Tax=Monopterus albus TaxID=43700 RepID=UPI0009B35485|nr:dual specificity protein kinase Ttk-like [Monopterus albus]